MPIHADLAEQPGKVKDAYIAQPVLQPMSGTPHYVTCVRYNAGKHQPLRGQQTNLVDFPGRQARPVPAGDPEMCGGLNYQRFPELEQLGPAD